VNYLRAGEDERAADELPAPALLHLPSPQPIVEPIISSWAVGSGDGTGGVRGWDAAEAEARSPAPGGFLISITHPLI